MIEMILSVLKCWKQILVVALIIAAYMFGVHNTEQAWQLKWEQQHRTHIEQIAQIQDDYNNRQGKIATDFIDFIRGRDNRIGQLRKELEDVKTKNDGSCTLLGGTIDWHDKLSTTGSTSTKALSTKQGSSAINSGSNFDVTPSGIALSTLLETVGNNYTVCINEMKRLESLQATVKAFQEEQKKVTK